MEEPKIFDLYILLHSDVADNTPMVQLTKFPASISCVLAAKSRGMIRLSTLIPLGRLGDGISHVTCVKYMSGSLAFCDVSRC